LALWARLGRGEPYRKFPLPYFDDWSPCRIRHTPGRPREMERWIPPACVRGIADLKIGSSIWVTMPNLVTAGQTVRMYYGSTNFRTSPLPVLRVLPSEFCKAVSAQKLPAGEKSVVIYADV